MGRFKTHEMRAAKKMRKLEEARQARIKAAQREREIKEPDSPALAKFASAIRNMVFGSKKMNWKKIQHFCLCILIGAFFFAALTGFYFLEHYRWGSCR